MEKNNTPILISKEVWEASQLSIVRYYGSINYNGKIYTLVNKEGKDIFECSWRAAIAGREKAIEPGEPADLVIHTFVKYYRKIGRRRFIAVLDANKNTPVNEMHEIFKQAIKNLVR